MRVYRIENKEGLGPYSARAYRSKEYPKWLEPYRDHTEKTPQICYPEAMKLTQSHVFGFVNRRQIREWFPRKIRNLLKREGLRCTIYEVPHHNVVIANRQVIFIKPGVK